MNILDSILLGIIQGLTEFIPVSSTAHLLIGQRLLGLTTDSGMFSFTVLIQLGTLFALIVYYWTDLWSIGKAVLSDIWYGLLTRRQQPFKNQQALLGWYILLGTIPAALAGLLMKNLIESLFKTQLVEALIRLLITTILLLVAEIFGHRNRKMVDLKWTDGLWVGIAQVLAVFPGSSRSGSTIAGGMLLNLDRPTAARFAFLLSVPVMLAAGAYETFDLLRSQHVAGSLVPSILIGILVSAVVGYLSIRWLLNFLARRPLYIFAAYCGIVVIVIAISLLM